MTWWYPEIQPAPYDLSDDGPNGAGLYLHPRAVAYSDDYNPRWVSRGQGFPNATSPHYYEGSGWQAQSGRIYGPNMTFLGHGWHTPWTSFFYQPRPLTGEPEGMRGGRVWIPAGADDVAVQICLQTPVTYFGWEQPGRDSRWQGFTVPADYYYVFGGAPERRPTDAELHAAYTHDLAGRFRLHLRQKIAPGVYYPYPNPFDSFGQPPGHTVVERVGPRLTVTLETPYPTVWHVSPDRARVVVEADGAAVASTEIPVAPFHPDQVLEGRPGQQLILTVSLSGGRLGVHIADLAEVHTPDVPPLWETSIDLPAQFRERGAGDGAYVGVEASHFAAFSPLGKPGTPWTYNWGQMVRPGPAPVPPLHQIHRDDGLNGGGQWQMAPNGYTPASWPWMGLDGGVGPGWSAGGPIWQISGTG